jgi:hypothetical protein
VQKSISSSLPATVIDCEECGHCVELYTPSPNDAAVLVDTRRSIQKYMDQWLA